MSTGVNNNQRMGAGAQFGAGLLWTVGAGVQVLIGATMIQNFGLYAQVSSRDMHAARREGEGLTP